MKTLLTALIIILIPVSMAWSGDVVFSGVRYDDGLLVTSGYGTKVTGNLWSFNYANWGNYGDVSSELVYFIKPEGFDKLSIGLLSGTNFDFIDDYGDGEPATTYLVGASGLLATYTFSGNTGLWGYGKYKYTLEPASNSYEDGYAFGGGLFYEF